MKYIQFLAFLISTFVVICKARIFGTPPEDMKLTFEEICDKNGYIHSSYLITTPDRYVLTVKRISGHSSESLEGQQGQNKQPIYFQHGILCSSDDWVLNSPDKSPAFLAVDQGYDVWLGNFRGNRYSRDHLDYDPSIHMRYWQFSWSEMGKYDIPTILEYIKS